MKILAFAIPLLLTFQSFSQIKTTTTDGHNNIKLTLLLDVSNSMDGLIDQAKAELWNIVNEASLASKNGQQAKLEIALYEYGRQSLTLKSNYVRKLVDFTSDLDSISEVLFALQTNGGEEYCGAVIQSAIDELHWRGNDSSYQVIFIAGNEPFNQGPIHYKQSCTIANQNGIIINTIHCGDSITGVREFWRDGAIIGNGQYFYINQNASYTEMATPFDSMIQLYNKLLNSTYIAYGTRGKSYLNKQAIQDKNAETMGASVATKRAVSKSKAGVYYNGSWDMVDAFQTDSLIIEKTKDEELPDEFKGKSDAEKKSMIAEKQKKRILYSKEIAKLNQQREEYIRAELAKRSNTEEMTLGKALIQAIRNQAKAKGFEFITK